MGNQPHKGKAPFIWNSVMAARVTRVIGLALLCLVISACDASSGGGCGPENCSGCCDRDLCVLNASSLACGIQGERCDVCAVTQQCVAGQCSWPNAGGGAGTGGGAPTGGGSAPTGGGATGGGGGSACQPPSNTALCASVGATCGPQTLVDNCGATRTLNCGACGASTTCSAGQCVCVAETNPQFCARVARQCGAVTAPDNCGAIRTVSSCGTCSSPLSCNPAGQCACTRETDVAFCARRGVSCGTSSGADNCGMARSVACGSCTSPNTCSAGQCSCAAESDVGFCQRLGATCGSMSGTDLCGNPKNVANCGTCSSPNTCGGAGVPNRCGCGQSDADFCAAHGAQCGQVSGSDRCNVYRSGVSCGACTQPQTCSASNLCVCVAESAAALCTRLGKNCGPMTALDNCGTSRSVTCGTCTAANTSCGGGGTTNVCGCVDQCAAGATRCSLAMVQTCVAAASGCLDWAPAAACQTGFVCDAVVSACVVDPQPPRLIAPLGGSLVSGRAVFRWQTDPTATDSEIELCSDLLCTNVVARLTGTNGATVPVPLARGAWFVRGVGRSARADLTSFKGARFTATRVIFVTGRPAISSALLGLVPDFDRDGRPETTITDPFAPNYPDIANIYFSWGTGTSSIWRGGHLHNGVEDGAFASLAINAGDVDGDGLPEVVTIDDGTQNPPTILRYGNVLQRYVAPGPLDYLVPAGDVDADGYADVLAVDRVPFSGAEGVTVTVLFGGPQGFGRVTSFQFDIPIALRAAGVGPVSVRGLGDVNGDGYSDVAFGINLLPVGCVGPQGPDPAYVEIRSGAAAAPLTQLLFRVDGFGSLTPLGDVDGDGFPDFGFFKTGKDCISPGVSRPDQVVVIFGGLSAPLRSSSWNLPPFTFPTCVDRFGVPANTHYLGSVVGGADLDGDGFGDVALGQWGYLAYDNCYSGTVGPSPGQVFALYGSQTGLLTLGQTLTGPDGNSTFFGFNTSMIARSGSSGGDTLLVRSHPFHGVGWVPAIPDRVRSYAGARGALVNTETRVSGAPDWSGDDFGYSILSGL